MKLYIRLIHLDLDLTDTEVQNTVSRGNMKFSPMSKLVTASQLGFVLMN